MPPVKPNPDKWYSIALRHFTTFCIIMGAMWWLAVPRVQAFINETVNDRITIIEKQLTNIYEKLNHIDEQLDRIEKQQKHG